MEDGARIAGLVDDVEGEGISQQDLQESRRREHQADEK